MEIRILGPLAVLDDGRPVQLPGPRQRALLACLLLRRGEPVSADQLIDEVWGNKRPADAAKALQVQVSRLRKVLGAPGKLETRGNGYALRLDPEELDLEQYERSVERGRAAFAAGDMRSAAATLREALALWRGPPLADFSYETFAQSEIARLEESHLETLEIRIEADLTLGRHASVIGELEHLLSRHPLRERPRAQLMLALYRSGRHAEALEAYRTLRQTLVEELGIEPSRELQDLEQAILRQDLGLAIAPPPPPRAERTAFVGRDDELEQLRKGLLDARARRGCLFLLSGEPGIGKSRLAEELAVRAREGGARILVGRCWEAGGAPAYWPWLHALRGYVRDRDDVALRRELGDGAPEIAQLLPELQTRFPDIPEPRQVDPETARFRLFEATVSLLRVAADERPLLVFLDDLHAADTPSLLLLRFLAAHLEDASLLVVGAYRDVDPTLHDPLATTLSQLIRLPTTHLLPLGGIGEDDIDRFIQLSCNVRPDRDLVTTLHRETEGNPLFVGEVVRLLHSEGRLEGTDLRQLAIPESVRAVIARRLDGLSNETNRILALASILGRDFDVEALGRLSGRASAETLTVLEEAIAARIISEATGTLGQLRFSHALVRDALYDDLSPARRVTLHREAGKALEERYRSDLSPHLAELAHHFARAAQGGDVDKAVEYCDRAGERAIRLLAYEEAVRLFELALEASALRPKVDLKEQCDLLLNLGDAQARAGNFQQAKGIFVRAAEIASVTNLADRLGHAAIGYGGRFVWEPGRGDPDLMPLLENALAKLPSTDSALRIRLMARLAGGPLTDVPEAEQRRAELSFDAVAMARRLGDPASLAYALDARWTAIWGPDTLEERGTVAAEVVATAAAAGDKELMHDGHIWCALAALELGDLTSVHAELAAQARLAQELQQPAQLWFGEVLRGTLATFEGRFKEAEELIPSALGLGRAAGLIADIYGTIQLWALRREQGRLQEVEGALADAARRFPMYEVLRYIRAHLTAELGQEQEARKELHALGADHFSTLARNDDWLFGLCLLADVSRELNDKAKAQSIYELLLPYANRNVVNPPGACIGSASRSLAVAAASAGRIEDAAGHFENAKTMNERMGALPWTARTSSEYGQLLARGGDVERARDLLCAARDQARGLGMVSLADRAEMELAGLAPATPTVR